LNLVPVIPIAYRMRLNSPPSTIMKACTNCGLAMNDDSVFCASCGTRFEEGTWRFHIDSQLSKEPELPPEIITATNASDFLYYRLVICIIIWFEFRIEQ
jgi:uncharacterized membrane protein YvbJ